MFIQDGDVQNRLAAVLKVDAANLDPYWTGTLIPKAHAKAYNEIVTRLSARGFSITAITSWDRGAEFEGDITLFWLLVEGAGLHDYDDRTISHLDRREELDTVLLTSGSAEITPDVSNEGKTIGSGVLNESMQGLQFRYGVGTGKFLNPNNPTIW